MQQPVLNDVCDDAAEISEQRQAADAPDVPEELDLLELQRGHRQKDADEEDDRSHVDPLQGADQREVKFFVVFLAAMDQFADHPEDAQSKKYSHKRRQVRSRLESGYEQEDSKPHIESEV